MHNSSSQSVKLYAGKAFVALLAPDLFRNWLCFGGSGMQCNLEGSCAKWSGQLYVTGAKGETDYQVLLHETQYIQMHYYSMVSWFRAATSQPAASGTKTNPRISQDLLFISCNLLSILYAYAKWRKVLCVHALMSTLLLLL